MRKYLFFLIALLITPDGSACTSAIVSGKCTSDGRPLMWKQRDTDNENNKLRYFTGNGFDYIGVVSAGKAEASVWIGMNEAGFSIMNTASYNLNDTLEQVKDRSEGLFMSQALMLCGSIRDFEKLLDTLSRPTGLQSNFGVIDSYGGAAYFEVGDRKWTKVDVNDPVNAPLGFIVRTNYSFSGDPKRGRGYARYLSAFDIFYRNAMINNLNPEAILQETARSLWNTFTRDDLKDMATGEKEVRLVHFNDNIARKSSTSSTVIRGIREGDELSSSTMWVVVGWPLAAVAYPAWFNPGKMLPEMLTAPVEAHAPLCDVSLELKKRSFPSDYGNGPEYLDINRIYNTDGTGYLQWMLPLEERIFDLSMKEMADWEGKRPLARQVSSLYKKIDELIIDEYGVKEPGLTHKFLKTR
jgi:hypothetical protein